MMRERAYYLDTYVAGRLYGDADLVWPNLKVGQSVIFARELDNKNDSSAIAVYVDIESEKFKLGYIPFRKNQPLALFIDMGWSKVFSASISRLDPTAVYDRQIGITVRILKNQGADRPQADTDT